MVSLLNLSFIELEKLKPLNRPWFFCSVSLHASWVAQWSWIKSSFTLSVCYICLLNLEVSLGKLGSVYIRIKTSNNELVAWVTPRCQQTGSSSLGICLVAQNGWTAGTLCECLYYVLAHSRDLYLKYWYQWFCLSGPKHSGKEWMFTFVMRKSLPWCSEPLHMTWS